MLSLFILNPLSATVEFKTEFLIGSYDKIAICLTNYNKVLKFLHAQLFAADDFCNTRSDWFNKLQNVLCFDQSAGTSQGIKTNRFSENLQYSYHLAIPILLL